MGIVQCQNCHEWFDGDEIYDITIRSKDAEGNVTKEITKPYCEKCTVILSEAISKAQGETCTK